MEKYADRNKSDRVTVYHEKKIGRTLYRVTSVYLGQVELGSVLEDLVVRKILRDGNMPD